MKKWIIELLITILTFLAPIKGILVLLVMFIVIDTAFAIYTSIKLNGKKSFSSTKLFNIVIKSFFYLSTVIMAFGADVFICGGSLFGIVHLLSKAMCVFWMYIEVKSLDETNMKLGNKSFWVLIREIMGKYKSIKKDIKKINQ